MAIFQKQHKINMGKYIDADKLITEIERLQHLNECYKRNWRWKFKWFSRTVIGRMEVLEGIKNLIASLQQEQNSVAERFARIVRGNLIGIDKEVQQKFEQLYFEVTGNKMYGGYND